MRSYLAAGTIAALLVLGLGPVVRGQQSQGRSGSTSAPSGGSSSGFAASTFGTAGGGQGGQSQSMFSQLGQMSRMNDLQSGAFVGADIQDARNAMMATGAQRAGQTVQASPSPFGSGRGFRQTGRLGSRTGFGSRRGTSEIRARIRVGFSVARPAPVQLGSRLAGRLEKSSWIRTQSPMEVAIVSGTAILRGAVATEHDRLLAERMARLEPGIRRVENQLTVVQPAVAPARQPTVE